MGSLGEEYGKFFFKQFVDVLEYLHSTNIVHCDLKIENILIDPQMNFKLIDFGFAIKDNITNLKHCQGTKTYMAPEIKE